MIMVEKFSAIVGTKNLNSCMKLCLHHLIELLKLGTDFPFCFEKGHPSHVCAIIYKRDKPLSSYRSGNFSRSPNIRMNKRKLNQTLM
ncbi:hypothetical protein ACE6H2_006946 [Prunus campanulata]